MASLHDGFLSRIALSASTRILAGNPPDGYILKEDIIDGLLDGAHITAGHPQYLTQPEIEALPGFGGSGGGDIPVGACMLWLGATAPSGWHLLDGTPVSESSAIGVHCLAIGQVSNGDGTVDLPDARDYMPMFAGPTYPLLSSGGEAEHTLSIAEMPAHSHGLNISLDRYSAGSRVDIGDGATLSSYETLPAGGGEAHNNLPPYLSFNLIMYGG